MNFYFVYVLLSYRDHKMYIGFTADIQRRLVEHQRGKNISTRYRRPFQLIFFEAFLAKADAERRERYFKTSKGKTMLKLCLRSYLSEIKECI